MGATAEIDGMIGRYWTRRRFSLGAAAVLALTAMTTLFNRVPAWASDPTTEEARLAVLVRQLDALERLAKQSAEQSPVKPARYHFDYARLHRDIARIRAGIQDYLSPVRAQPRDPQPLNGQYRIDAEAQP